MKHQYEIFTQGQKIEKASKALILIHGRGGSALDMLSLANQFSDDSFYVAAPQATNKSWYPYSFMEEESLNEPFLSSAIETVKKITEEISNHVPKKSIYILGFSQGACLTLEFASQFADRYGGIIAFTGGLIGKILNPKKYQGNFKGTQVFIGNSDKDRHVPLSRSQQSKELMEEIGAKVTLKIYPGMGHQINQDEMIWVKKHIFESSD